MRGLLTQACLAFPMLCEGEFYHGVLQLSQKIYFFFLPICDLTFCGPIHLPVLENLEPGLLRLTSDPRKTGRT